MIALRNADSGEIQIMPSADVAAAQGYAAPDWVEIDTPPGDGWTWNNATQAWVAPAPPRLWVLRLFFTTLFTPMEFLTIRQWQPAGTPTADDLTFMWAREVILTLPVINLDDSNTTAALAMCQARSLLSEARVARILAGLPPA